MNRLLVKVGLVISGLMICLGGNRAWAQYSAYCPGPATAYSAPAPQAGMPFVGSSYAFTSPGSSSYYTPTYSSYYGPGFPSGYPAFDYNYPRPAYDASYFINPGPYYYTRASSYTPGYYSYYYTPGYFRY